MRMNCQVKHRNLISKGGAYIGCETADVHMLSPFFPVFLYQLEHYHLENQLRGSSFVHVNITCFTKRQRRDTCHAVYSIFLVAKLFADVGYCNVLWPCKCCPLVASWVTSTAGARHFKLLDLWRILALWFEEIISRHERNSNEPTFFKIFRISMPMSYPMTP